MNKTDEPEKCAGDLLSKALKSLIMNVFIAETSFDYILATDAYLEGIKNNGYSNLIDFLQKSAFTRMILCVYKLFDSSPKSYNVYRTLKIVEAGANALPIKKRDKLLMRLKDIVGHKSNTTYLGFTDQRLVMEIVSLYRPLLPDKSRMEPLSLALKNIRQQRNSVIAHDDAEPAARLIKLTKDDVLLLLDFAKTFIGVIHSTFVNEGIFDNEGRYIQPYEKNGPDVQLQKLLTKAGVPRADFS
jgi:hypothetical protein